MKRLKETGILIPTYNAMSCVTFPELLRKLSAIRDEIGRLLIIDSSSTDETVALATSLGFDVRVIPKHEFSHATTRNKGIHILINEFKLNYAILLTQDAGLTTIESIKRIIKPFDREKMGAVCGRQIPHDNANPVAAHSRFFNYKEYSYLNNKKSISKRGLKAAFMSNSFAAYNLKILSECNSFPKGLIFGEDMHLSAQMIVKGFNTYYESRAIVKHSHNYSLFEEFKRYFDIGVFHSTAPFLLENFKSPNNEGIKYLVSELNYCFKKGSVKWWLNSLIRSGLKLLSYALGRNYMKINVDLCRKMSMDKNYWNKK